MFNDAMLCFQYALVEADGTPLSGLRRQVTVQRIATTMNGYTRQLPEEKLIVGKWRASGLQNASDSYGMLRN